MWSLVVGGYMRRKNSLYIYRTLGSGRWGVMGTPRKNMTRFKVRIVLDNILVDPCDNKETTNGIRAKGTTNTDASPELLKLVQRFAYNVSSSFATMDDAPHSRS
jgi:hypothetical protein